MALYAFDGTSKEDEIDDDEDSNVVRFARAYRGTRVYLPGVGTRFGAVGAIFGGWMGLGLHDRVSKAMKAAERNFQRGDTVVDVIGFSRGAAAALHFANELWEKRKKFREKTGVEPAVRFLGLFDTVASTGFFPGRIDLFLDLEVPPNVQRCCHAMALDEGRASFHLHRMKPRKKNTLAADAIQEVWFRGCHSDIGGGRDHEKLANITLCWMLRQAAAAGARFDAGYVQAAIEGRQASGNIKRAKLDEGLKKREPRPTDFVHRSVVDRDSAGGPWHVNPPAGCRVIDDLGPECGPFPFAGDWPVAPEPAWIPALVPPATLAVGAAAVVVEVFADTEWNEIPHIRLEQGATYRFTIVDGPHDWVDGSITDTNGAAGYDRPHLDAAKGLARYPKAGWLALIGAVDRDELFPIGAGGDYTPAQSGEFGAFANDAWFRYGNNRGRLKVSVQRIG
jgi:hypothetical protein